MIKIKLIQTKQVFLFEDEEEITIGKSSKNRLVIPEEFELVSRRHAVIKKIDGVVTITDISSNGTFIVKRSNGYAIGQRIDKGIAIHVEFCKFNLGNNIASDKTCLLKIMVKGELMPAPVRWE
jgi:pSer/pThr/pTyr-binding forkhead associated (FHA) protein